MFRKTMLAGVLLLLCVSYALAQRRELDMRTDLITVRVTYENDRSIPTQVRIDLIDDVGSSVQHAFLDAEGRAEFVVPMTPQIVYRVQAGGMNIEDEISERFSFDHGGGGYSVYLQVKPKLGSAETTKTPSAGPITSAGRLNIPKEASKDFHKGLEAWQNKDYAKAAEYLEKATAEYPQYDAAFNYLGVMYAHLQQPDKARAAFETAVRLNDKNAEADRNLAGIVLREKDFARTQELAHKSLAVEPQNVYSLTLLAMAEYQSENLDAALQDARKVHELPHENYAVCHFIAGQVLERKHQYPEAIAEYNTYLSESPNGPEATQVKNALARASLASAQPAEAKQ
jgi:Tfp pilus assembly protein PilF